MILKRVMVSTLLCLVPAVSAAADALEEAVDKLTAGEARLKSMTAKYKMTQDMDLGEGNRIKSNSEGTVEWMRKGDKKLYRSTAKTSGVQNFGGQETKSEQTATMVSDGEVLYTFSEQRDEKTVFKQKADPSLDDNPKALIENLKEDYDIKLLSDEKVDGADCVVIEATAKESQADPMVKQVFYFRKDSGINVKMVARDKSDKPVLTHMMSDIKLNSEIPADHFVFKAPEGVKVMDLTQDAPPDKQP